MTNNKSDMGKNETDAFAPGSQVDHWVMRMTQGPLSVEESRAFTTWLLDNPEHEREFECGADVFDQLSHLRNDPSVADWARPSLYERVAGLGYKLMVGLKALRRPKFAIPIGGLSLAGASVALALFVFAAPVPPIPSAPPVGFEPDLVTTIAEVREEALPDGSTVTLGAASSIDVQFSDQERRVVLTAGEAFFDVTKNPGRPFLVVANETVIRVLGTKFDVSLGLVGVDVSVSEGRVEVIKPANVEASIRDEDIKHVLLAGQRVTAVQQGPVRPVETIEAADVAVWREGDLVWRNAPMAEIIADLNRYTENTVILANPALAQESYTFSLRADDTDLAIDVIAETLGLRVRRKANGDLEIR